MADFQTFVKAGEKPIFIYRSYQSISRAPKIKEICVNKLANWFIGAHLIIYIVIPDTSHVYLFFIQAVPTAKHLNCQ